MYHPRVSGGYYEMGQEYGRNLHKHGFQFPVPSQEKLDFAAKGEREILRAFPDVLEEIKGLADASHSSYEAGLAFLLGIGVFKPGGACSAFAVSDRHGTIVGRNYDFFYRFGEFAEAYLTRPGVGLWSVGHTDIFVGREDGMNEEGLAVAISFVASTMMKPGINFPLAVRCLLDTCRDVEEGISALRAMHLSTSNNYLLADAEGDMAVAEATPELVRVRRPEGSDDFVICTNHFVHPDTLEVENVKERDSDSLDRYAAIQTGLRTRRGSIGIGVAKAILSDHRGFVCSHRDEIKLGTLWSLVASPASLEMLRAEGHPCKTQYKVDPRLNTAVETKRN